LNTEKNVLFISYDGMTDPLGQSQVLPYLIGLRKAGYQIFLLSCEKSAAFEQHETTIRNIVALNDLHWFPITYTKKPPVLSTLWDIVQLKKKAKEIHLQHNIHMVHTRPGIPALVGLWMKKKYGIKFLNDIREFFADSRVEGHMWNLANPLYKTVYNYFKKKESEAVKLNDGIVCLTYAAEKIINTWPEYSKDIPLQVIPCSADLDLFNPENINNTDKEMARADLNIQPDDFIISYLGSIGGWYLTDEMMQLCKVLADEIPRAKFLFISPHRHDDIRLAAEKAGLEGNKIITTKANRKQVPLYLSLSNLSIFFIRPCYSKQSSSPTKHGEIMALGIPIITNAGVGDVEMIVRKYNSGYIVADFSTTSYKTVSKEITNGAHFNAEFIREGSREFYSLEKAIESYTSIYQAIIGLP
jgi:glycosyltransferase involved in cell wall biosynthesis